MTDKKDEDELFPNRIPLPENPAEWRQKLRESHLKFDEAQKGVYLNDLANHGLKSKASSEAGVSKQLVDTTIKEDKEFAQQVEEALEAYAQWIQGEARKQFVRGVDSIKVNRGAVVKDDNGNVIVEKLFPNNPMMQMELKRVNPAYREKTEIDLNVKSGVLVAPATDKVEDWIGKHAKIQPAENEEDNKKT